MNIKKVVMGAVLGIIAVGVVYAVFSSNRQNKESQLGSAIGEFKESTTEEKAEVKETQKKQELEVVSYQKKYYELYRTELYEVVVKSNANLEKVTFTFGKGTYELYNVQEGEMYVITASSEEEEINLSIMSVSYVLDSNENLSLKLNVEGNKIKGVITNNSDMDIYPNQIALDFKDENDVIKQATIEYSGCFFEGLIIKANTTFEFEYEIPEGYTYLLDKGVEFKYSDLSFTNFNVVKIKEM